MNKYDLIIVGAGPAGIFTALELVLLKSNKKILMLEKGNSLERRTCPKRKLGYCVPCQPCHITAGFSGAGAFSDGKLSLSPDVGGILYEYIGWDHNKELIDYCDNLYVRFGADQTVHGINQSDKIEEIRKKAIQSNLKLIECPIRHLGTDAGFDVYREIERFLRANGVEIKFRTPVKDLISENGKIKGVITHKEQEFYSDTVVVAVGREGSEWFKNICEKHNVATEAGPVDIGVRVEVRDEIMKSMNEAMYEGKLVYYTPTYDDKVRVFCSNPSGEVASEHYDDHLAVVNGHSYKSEKMKTKNTNFALLVSLNFPPPFKDSIEYGKHIAKIANMLTNGHVMVQTLGDLKRGRASTKETVYRNNIQPTLKDAVPGDLTAVLPYRVIVDLLEMIEAIDKVNEGINSDETLLYGVEVKFYSNRVKVDNHFQTTLEGLYAIGDGAGITRGLMAASVNGTYLARHLNNI